MGKLVQGKWVDQWYDTKKDGQFHRESPAYLNKIENPESGRYHLYVSLACPWAHRTLIFRILKNLESHISVSVVSPDMLEHGWTFDTTSGSSGDQINNFKYLYEVYTATDAKYSGRVTVPVLWDKKTKKIVNNESSSIIRILNKDFNALTKNEDDYYPDKLQKKIDEINAFIYENINNGVYKCGFATTQEAYEEAYKSLFSALDYIESILTSNRYLVGNNITEADWRLFTTLIRFDEVYYSHFKCNKKRIEDYPNLSAYRRELYQWPGIAQTTDFAHIKRHYYFSHIMINPTQIVPVGPEINYWRTTL
jgi:putative glutathione S-transferase